MHSDQTGQQTIERPPEKPVEPFTLTIEFNQVNGQVRMQVPENRIIAVWMLEFVKNQILNPGQQQRGGLFIPNGPMGI